MATLRPFTLEIDRSLRCKDAPNEARPLLWLRSVAVTFPSLYVTSALAGGSFDRSARVWSSSYGELVDVARRLVPRELTRDEREGNIATTPPDE